MRTKPDTNYILLNGSQTTSFIYNLSSQLDKNTVEEINSIKSLYVKLAKLKEYGVSIKYARDEQMSKGKALFYNNLIMIDSCMPELLASMLVVCHSKQASKVSEITEQTKKENPFSFEMAQGQPFYECKIKRLLVQLALGMKPTDVWNGIGEPHAERQIKMELEEIGKDQTYSLSGFENYLYSHTKFETSLPDDCHNGIIEQTIDGRQILTMNLQIVIDKH